MDVLLYSQKDDGGAVRGILQYVHGFFGGCSVSEGTQGDWSSQSVTSALSPALL